MRTTITLDDGLARRLQDEMRIRGTTFRQTLESVLAKGLENSAKSAKKGSFRVKPRPMGLKSGIDPARLQDLDTDLEVEGFHEVVRKGKSGS